LRVKWLKPLFYEIKHGEISKGPAVGLLTILSIDYSVLGFKIKACVQTSSISFAK